MRAYWLDAPERPVPPELLNDEGVLYRRLPTDPALHEDALSALSQARGYVERDEVALTPSTEGLGALCDQFAREHLHDDDEVRFVLEGEGFFDIRSRGDRFMRVHVEPGDLIVVPKGRHHRFMLSERRTIRCVRLFRDPRGWAPQYRAR